MRKSRKSFLAFFGHHKCATKWVMRIVNNVYRQMGLKHTHFHSPKMWGFDLENTNMLDRVVYDLGVDFVSYTSADLRYIGNINNFRGFHIIRDPRDIIVSAYFSHRYSHSVTHWPELVEFRPFLERLPKDEGLLANIDFTAKLKVDGWNVENFETMMNWDYSMPNILELKFERLVESPYTTFLDIFKFLGLSEDNDLRFFQALRYYISSIWKDWQKVLQIRSKNPRIPNWLILYFVYANRYSKLATGRKKGDEKIDSHYRKGVPGDWKNHFKKEHNRYFKKQYNDLLIKLGYEKDDRW